MEHGDLQKLASTTGVHYITIHRAIKNKRCKSELHEKTNSFLEKRN